MNYYMIEQMLISSISEDDPHKVSKRLQIKQWVYLYGSSLLRSSPRNYGDFIVQVISDDNCWNKVDSLEGIKLNSYEVGRRLISAKTPNGNKNPFSNMQKYKVACWCCFEDQIRELWDEAQSTLTYRKPIVSQLDSTYAEHGLLVTYWTHYITDHMDKFKDKLKLAGNNNDLHGFEIAVRGQHVEALRYFWAKLLPVLSEKEKEDLLIYTATYEGIFVGQASADMVDFAMHHLDEGKYRKLLEQAVSKGRLCASLYQLIDSYLFDRAEKLFRCLTQEDISYDDYHTTMYNILSSIVSVPNERHIIDAGYKMLTMWWHSTGFGEHKQFFMNRLSCGYPPVNKIGHLVQANETSDILSEIVSSLNIEQVKYLQNSLLWAYKIFKSANLFNDDVIKHLAETEQTVVNTLDKQENIVVVLGDSS